MVGRPLNVYYFPLLSFSLFKIDSPADSRRLIAKFNYTDPTGPARTRTDPNGPARTLSETRTDPTEFRRKKSPCGSVRVRSGPVGPV